MSTLEVTSATSQTRSRRSTMFSIGERRSGTAVLMLGIILVPLLGDMQACSAASTHCAGTLPARDMLLPHGLAKSLSSSTTIGRLGSAASADPSLPGWGVMARGSTRSVPRLRLRGGGVPKFWRWLSERYPLINKDVKDSPSIPEIDNLYLDMNGIIHPCTHGNSDSVVEQAEDEMFGKICEFLDQLVQLTKPRQLLYLAIDGVAPRAKMNQQRARRFRAAQQLKGQIEKASKNGEEVSDKPFDSNCITPGTTFMARLTKHLRYYIRSKLEVDALWRTPKIILSGHEVPGEGEHKVMEYIRRSKSQPGYQANLRHCVYGNDADLVMLALATHEPHFVLLRQTDGVLPNRRGRGGREVSKSEKAELDRLKGWQFLHICVLRDYLHLEFQTLEASLEEAGISYDLERLVDDFVLLCYFVGNDFLPHLPTLDINTGGLNMLLRLYKKLLPTWHGFLTDAGDVDMGRLQDLMVQVGKIETEMFRKRLVDKRSGNLRAIQGHFADLDDHQWEREQMGGEMQEDDAIEEIFENNGMDEAEGEDTFGGSKETWRAEYYKDKFAWGLGEEDQDNMLMLQRSYVEGIQWCFAYYYRGCVAWRWYYPYHYTPLASDLRGLREYKFDFTLGEPCAPFQQLLSVLPRESGELLPKSYSDLMTAPNSPIALSFPSEFKVDMEGKAWDWEAVTLIPFLNETHVEAAIASVPKGALTPDEERRNMLGIDLCFAYDASRTDTVQAPTKTLPDLIASHTREDVTHLPPFTDKCPSFRPVLCEGVRLGASAPAGYPSLFTRPLHAPHLYVAGVDVFGRPSKRESVTLSLGSHFDLGAGIIVSKGIVQREDGREDGDVLASLIGREAWSGWPYLAPCQIVGACDGSMRYVKEGEGGRVSTRNMQHKETDEYLKRADEHKNAWKMKCGVDIGHVGTMISVSPLMSMVQSPSGAVKRLYSQSVDDVAVQLIQLTHNSADHRFDPVATPDPSDTLPVGSAVLVMGGPGSVAGSLGTVIGVDKDGKVVVDVTPSPLGLTTFEAIVHQGSTGWRDMRGICGAVNLPASAAGRTMSSLLLRAPGEKAATDVGLGVYFTKKELVMAGYVRRGEHAGLEFSPACVALLREFVSAFPHAFKALAKYSSDPVIDAVALLQAGGMPSPQRRDASKDPDDSVKRYVDKMKDWVSRRLGAAPPLVQADSQSLMGETVAEMEASIQRIVASSSSSSNIPKDSQRLILPLSQILAPVSPGIKSSLLGAAAPPGGRPAFKLGDRVVSALNYGVVPFGKAGTVVALSDSGGWVDVLLDEWCLTASTLNGRCSSGRGLRIKGEALLNLSRAREAKLGGGGGGKRQQVSGNAGASGRGEGREGYNRGYGVHGGASRGGGWVGGRGRGGAPFRGGGGGTRFGGMRGAQAPSAGS